MSYQQAQLHLIRTVIQLKKVAITVRFPCSISFALKTQNSLTDHKGVYQLTKGQSIINQTIQIQVQVPFAKGRYEEQKVSLLIFMVSANGRIPAGTVTINPTEKIILDKKAPLEKCPDKNAEVTYTESYEKVRVIRQITQSKASRNNLAASNVSGYSFLNRSQVQYASTANLAKNEHNNELKPYEEESRRSQIERNGYRSNEGNSLKNSQVGSQGEKKYFNKFAKNRVDEAPKRSLYGIGQKDNFQMRMSRASNQVAQGLEWQVQSQKSKIIKLEQQKTGYIKQIVKLKGSLVRVQSEERFHIEDQFNRVKTQKSELQEEVQKLKERTKYQEKKQRQSGSMLKQLREELDKKKSRIIQLDSSKTQIQSQLMQKDRLISSLQSQKKKLQQSLQEEKALQQSIQKRLDLKENSYKDQIKKISEKYAQSEAERQKAMLDYNSLLLQIQNAEKRNQTQLRDKQKSFNEEKSKLNKKIEQLLAEATEIQQKLSDKINHIRDLEYSNKKIIQQERERRQKYSNLKQQYDDLALKAKNLQQQKKALSQQIKNIENALSQEKSGNKKKNMDCHNELGVLKEKYQKITMINSNIQQKIKDLESRLQKQTKDKAVLLIKLDELKKAQHKYLQDEQARERLAETLSISNISQNNKLSEFKSRLQSERKKYQTMQTKYEQQVQYLVRSKEQLQGEAQELKWLLESEIKKSQTLNAKYRQLNDQIIELSQKIIKNEEEFVRLDEEKTQLNSKISSLQLEIAHLKNSSKALAQSLKKKEQDYFIIQKKGSSQEQELFMAQNRHQSAIKDLRNRIDTLQNDVNLKNNKLKEREQELIMMNEDLSAMRALQAKQKNQIGNKNNEIVGLKESNEVLQSDFMGLLNKNEKLQQQLNDKQEQIDELLRKIKENKSEYQSIDQQNNNRKVQFKQYKQSFRYILQQFFNHWNQQQYLDPRQLKTLPDGQLSQLQTVCSKKIYMNYQRQQDKMKAQTKIIQQVSESNMRLKGQLQQLRNEHADKLSNEIHSQKIIKVEMDQQIAALNSKIDELVTSNEQKSSQIQFLNSSVTKYEEMIAEFTEESIRNHKTHSTLLAQIDVLERQIFQFKEKEVKSKLMSSTQLEELKHLIKEERQRHESGMKSLKQAILGKQKQLADKVEQIKRWVLVESQLKIQQTKYIEETKELGSKLTQQTLSKKTLQKSLHQRQRVIKELQQQMSNLKANLQFQRNKEKHAQEQVKRLQSDIHHLQIKSKSIEEQQRFKHISTQQTQRRQRERRQKLQAAKAKLEQQNKQARQKCVKLESEVQFYKFYKEQSGKKIAQYEKMKEASFMEMIRYKQSVLKSQRQLGNYENKHYKLQMEIEHITRQKELLTQSNNKFKQRLDDYQQKAQGYNQVLNELESRDRQISRLKDNTKIIQQQNDKIVQELKNSLSKYKEELVSSMTRIKLLETKLEDKNSDLNTERQKITAQYESERSMYQIKLQTYQENMRVLQEQLEFQKEQSTREIQGANSIIQELNQVIRQKQEHLQSRQQIINQQNVRLEELNLQLIQCVNKWQKEKEAYVPASSKLTEINEELLRMNRFMSELDGRNKQLLQVNKRKMQQTLQNKPSITQILKQFYIVMQKSKNKILNRCQTQKEKQAVMQEFKVVQEKLDLTLKSTQIVTLKQ